MLFFTQKNPKNFVLTKSADLLEKQKRKKKNLKSLWHHKIKVFIAYSGLFIEFSYCPALIGPSTREIDFQCVLNGILKR